MSIRTPLAVLRRLTRRGDQGHPIATIAFYGPDDRRASKVVLGIFDHDGAQPRMEKWLSEIADLRKDMPTLQAILNRIIENRVKSVAMLDKVFGCPHEAGIDYPSGSGALVALSGRTATV